MGLEDYWGVGPKTRARLEDALGTEGAVRAIQSADVRALTGAGLSSGRATAILRRTRGGDGMAVLATRDARAVYRAVLDLAAEHALTRHAADRVRVLTPLRSREAIEARLDDVMAAVETWAGLSEVEREAVLAAFDAYDGVGGDRASVEAAIALSETGASGPTFEPIDSLAAADLHAASAALGKLDGDGSVGEGADPELDRLRSGLETVEAMEGSAFDVLETLREEGVRGTEEFREAVVDHVRRETDVAVETIREAAPDEAADAADFVGTTLRRLAADLRERVEKREATVAEELRGDVDAARDDVDAAVAAVDHVSRYLSLARFALAYDLSRPTIVEGRDALAVSGARNLLLVANDGDGVQPITYGIGQHGIDGPPADDRVAVLTGANSGGKTTLLETLCQVSILAQMGLPVPAERAEVSVTDAVVLHRRHASFNAGVLESTLRTVVPPLARGNRTLMLVDEFEAITEPGSAADLLHGLVTLTVERDALGVFVTHLADDLKPLPDVARIDGIFAEGLDAELDLIVDYQPRFGTVGRSTPEFIVSRLVANADDRAERAAFETLAAAVGQEVVQRTLRDVRWQ